MNKILILLFFTLTYGCTNPPKSSDKQAKIYSKLGTAHLISNNYPLALKNLLISEKLNPSDPVTQNNLGLAYLVRGKYKLAAKHMNKAIELKPDYTESRNNLGRVYIHMGDYNKAIQQLRIANKDLTYTAPEQTLSNLGIAYFEIKRYQSARSALRKSLKIRRQNCQTLNFYGRTLFELKKFKLANQTFDAAMPLCAKESFDQPFYFGALSYNQTGNREKAKALLIELKKTFPESTYKSQATSLLKILEKAP